MSAQKKNVLARLAWWLVLLFLAPLFVPSAAPNAPHSFDAALQFAYDGDGNRVGKTVTTSTNSVTTHYLVDDLNSTRYHNAATGRFWTMDRFEGFAADPVSLHKYSYGGNNPINRVDPSGNLSIAEVTTAAGLGGGAALLVNVIANAWYARSQDLAFSDLYSVSDAALDTGIGAAGGLLGGTAIKGFRVLGL